MIGLSSAANNDWNLCQFDDAFLLGDLEEEFYMEVSFG